MKLIRSSVLTFTSLLLFSLTAFADSSKAFLNLYVKPLLAQREDFYQVSISEPTASAPGRIILRSGANGNGLGQYEIILNPKLKDLPGKAPELEMKWGKRGATALVEMKSTLELPLSPTEDPTSLLRSMIRSDFLLHPMMTPPGYSPKLAGAQLDVLKQLKAFRAEAKRKGETTKSIVILPPGFGKTVIAGKMLADVIKESSEPFKIIFAVQNKDILDDATAKLQEMLGLKPRQVKRVYGESSKEDLLDKDAVLVSTTRTTLHRNLEDIAQARSQFKGRFLIVLDEVHHAGKIDGEFDRILKKLLAALTAEDLLLGLSGTPWHNDSDLIEKIFLNNVATTLLTPEELKTLLQDRRLVYMARLMMFRAMAQGYLSPIHSYRQVRYLDEQEGDMPILARDFLNDWSRRFVDLSESERFELLKREVMVHVPLVKQLLKEIRATFFRDETSKRLLVPNRGIIFVPSIAHANIYSYLLNQRGGKDLVFSKPYHSGLSDDERGKTIDWFRDQEISSNGSKRYQNAAGPKQEVHKYLFVIRALGEGVDEPRVNHIVLAKPYSEEDFVGMRELIQNLGRGGRLSYPKPHFHITDFTGDMKRLLFEDMDQKLVNSFFVQGGEQDFAPQPPPAPKVKPTVVLDYVTLKEEKFDTSTVAVPETHLRAAVPNALTKNPFIAATKEDFSQLTSWRQAFSSEQISAALWKALLEKEYPFNINVQLHDEASLLKKLNAKSMSIIRFLESSETDVAGNFPIYKSLNLNRYEIEILESIIYKFRLNQVVNADLTQKADSAEPLLQQLLEKVASFNSTGEMPQTPDDKMAKVIRSLVFDHKEKYLQPLSWREVFEKPGTLKLILKDSGLDESDYGAYRSNLFLGVFLDFISGRSTVLNIIAGDNPQAAQNILAALKTYRILTEGSTLEKPELTPALRNSLDKKSPWNRLQLTEMHDVRRIPGRYTRRLVRIKRLLPDPVFRKAFEQLADAKIVPSVVSPNISSEKPQPTSADLAAALEKLPKTQPNMMGILNWDQFLEVEGSLSLVLREAGFSYNQYKNTFAHAQPLFSLAGYLRSDETSDSTQEREKILNILKDYGILSPSSTLSNRELSAVLRRSLAKKTPWAEIQVVPVDRFPRNSRNHYLAVKDLLPMKKFREAIDDLNSGSTEPVPFSQTELLSPYIPISVDEFNRRFPEVELEPGQKPLPIYALGMKMRYLFARSGKFESSNESVIDFLTSTSREAHLRPEELKPTKHQDLMAMIRSELKITLSEDMIHTQFDKMKAFLGSKSRPKNTMTIRELLESIHNFRSITTATSRSQVYMNGITSGFPDYSVKIIVPYLTDPFKGWNLPKTNEGGRHLLEICLEIVGWTPERIAKSKLSQLLKTDPEMKDPFFDTEILTADPSSWAAAINIPAETQEQTPAANEELLQPYLEISREEFQRRFPQVTLTANQRPLPVYALAMQYRLFDSDASTNDRKASLVRFLVTHLNARRKPGTDKNADKAQELLSLIRSKLKIAVPETTTNAMAKRMLEFVEGKTKQDKGTAALRDVLDLNWIRLAIGQHEFRIDGSFDQRKEAVLNYLTDPLKNPLQPGPSGERHPLSKALEIIGWSPERLAKSNLAKHLKEDPKMKGSFFDLEVEITNPASWAKVLEHSAEASSGEENRQIDTSAALAAAIAQIPKTAQDMATKLLRWDDFFAMKGSLSAVLREAGLADNEYYTGNKTYGARDRYSLADYIEHDGTSHDSEVREKILKILKDYKILTASSTLANRQVSPVLLQSFAVPTPWTEIQLMEDSRLPDHNRKIYFKIKGLYPKANIFAELKKLHESADRAQGSSAQQPTFNSNRLLSPYVEISREEFAQRFPEIELKPNQKALPIYALEMKIVNMAARTGVFENSYTSIITLLRSISKDTPKPLTAEEQVKKQKLLARIRSELMIDLPSDISFFHLDRMEDLIMAKGESRATRTRRIQDVLTSITAFKEVDSAIGGRLDTTGVLGRNSGQSLREFLISPRKRIELSKTYATTRHEIEIALELIGWTPDRIAKSRLSQLLKTGEVLHDPFFQKEILVADPSSWAAVLDIPAIEAQAIVPIQTAQTQTSVVKTQNNNQTDLSEALSALPVTAKFLHPYVEISRKEFQRRFPEVELAENQQALPIYAMSMSISELLDRVGVQVASDVALIKYFSGNNDLQSEQSQRLLRLIRDELNIEFPVGLTRNHYAKMNSFIFEGKKLINPEKVKLREILGGVWELRKALSAGSGGTDLDVVPFARARELLQSYASDPRQGLFMTGNPEKPRKEVAVALDTLGWTAKRLVDSGLLEKLKADPEMKSSYFNKEIRVGDPSSWASALIPCDEALMTPKSSDDSPMGGTGIN